MNEERKKQIEETLAAAREIEGRIRTLEKDATLLNQKGDLWVGPAGGERLSISDWVRTREAIEKIIQDGLEVERGKLQDLDVPPTAEK